MDVLKHHISDESVRWLLSEVIGSFHSTEPGKGLPLGNLTSQLLVKRKDYLENLLLQINIFILERLKLVLHPQKISIKTLASGVDFLGWIHFPDHRVLRTATKRRMMRRIAESPKPETLNSYLGLLKHGNARKLIGEIEFSAKG
jgi:hypothetical protein